MTYGANVNHGVWGKPHVGVPPSPCALKGQPLLAQGNALGIMAFSNAPCKGKSFKISPEKIYNNNN